MVDSSISGVFGKGSTVSVLVWGEDGGVFDVIILRVLFFFPSQSWKRKRGILRFQQGVVILTRAAQGLILIDLV